MTLQFLGAVEEDRVPALQAALGEVSVRGAAFSLQLAGAGAFGRQMAPSVLWLGASQSHREPEFLARWLGERLRPLGFLPDERAYVPHLTLARAGGRAGEPGFPGCVEALGHARFDGFRVERLLRVETLPNGSYATVYAAPLPAWRFSAHTSEVQLELEGSSLAGLLAAGARGRGGRYACGRGGGRGVRGGQHRGGAHEGAAGGGPGGHCAGAAALSPRGGAAGGQDERGRVRRGVRGRALRARPPAPAGIGGSCW
ncbi:MAG: RNA 2',3'-cyclic phosphodiesterase [Deltaproteobacteria bacterium]|nr:RNA 2',3'-cyclic phosphodiesterase [Deltaproteobacteria bacterium]